MKLWSVNIELIEQAKQAYENGAIQFIELYAVPNTKSCVQKFSKLNVPFVVHCMHINHGFNISDISLEQSNIAFFKEVLSYADLLSARDIIVHPGFNGTPESVLRQLPKFRSLLSPKKRILLENLPEISIDGKMKGVGVDIDDFKQFVKVAGNFCLDFSHAFCAALSAQQDPKKYISKLALLNPALFHLCGSSNETERDVHLALNDDSNDIDLEFVKKLVLNSSHKRVTFEIPRKKHDSIVVDLENIEYFRNL